MTGKEFPVIQPIASAPIISHEGLAKHLGLSIKFPFKIDVDGGTKAQLDFRIAYNKGLSSSESATDGSTIQKTYAVRIPARGWDVTVNPR